MRITIQSDVEKLFETINATGDGTLEIGKNAVIDGHVIVNSIADIGVIGEIEFAPGTTLKSGESYGVAINDDIEGSAVLTGKITGVSTSAEAYDDVQLAKGDFGVAAKGVDIFLNYVSGPGAELYIWQREEDFTAEGGPILEYYKKYGNALGGVSFTGSFDLEPNVPQSLPAGITATGVGYKPLFTEEQYQSILELIA